MRIFKSKEIDMKLTESTRTPHVLHYKIFQSSDRDCLFVGAKHWDISKSDKCKQVCSVDWFAGMDVDGGDYYIESLDQVFALLNGACSEDEYDCHVSGYRIVEGVRESDGYEYCFRDMHSLSVGDIIVDHSPDGDGRAYIVDSYGFKQIDFEYFLEERFVSHMEEHGPKKAAPAQKELDLEVA